MGDRQGDRLRELGFPGLAAAIETSGADVLIWSEGIFDDIPEIEAFARAYAAEKGLRIEVAPKR